MLSSNVANSSVSLASALVMPDGRSVLSFNDKNYFNATYTAGLFGKRPFNIMKGSSWENRLAHVSERTGVPVEELVVTVRGGDDTAQVPLLRLE